MDLRSTEEKFPCRTIPLAGKWVAVILEDDTILLQWHGTVTDANTGNRFDPASPPARELNPSKILVRTMRAFPDGSVVIDPHGLSPSGIPSGQSFAVLEAADVAMSRFDKKAVTWGWEPE